MIPFASQRASGQDLATHLMNAHDNEHMEVVHLRGAIAQDLHGAFAEWEAQAAALTRCRNYLYSLSVNPDPSHGQLSREQYLAYIDLVEEELGLSGQPRAVVFHVKEGREHCHVIWSRIDVRAGKARHLAFDHDKLMMATRLFAREHGITLPRGYYNDEPGPQLSLYEKVQQDQTGLSLDERKAVVTDLWRRSDSAAAFVSALAESGYILATGKRPFLLVDLYGHVNALPKLIDDREVRTADVREFLGQAYDPEGLPSVEEAQALAAQHRQALEDFEKARIASGKEDELKQRQASRRAELEAQIAALTARQRKQLSALDERHKARRQALRAAYLAEIRRIRLDRARRRPTGLAAFLGSVSGVTLIRKKLQRYRDRKRYEAFLAARRTLRDRQQAQRIALVLSHQLRALELERQDQALTQVEQRELDSLETALMKERRQRINGRHAHMPPVTLLLDRTPSLTDELNAAAQPEEEGALTMAFRQAGADDQGEDQSGDAGSADGIESLPEAEQVRRDGRRKRSRRRKRENKKGPLSKAFERAGKDETGESGGGDAGSTGAPHPPSEPKQERRPRRERKRERRRKARDRDHARDQEDTPLRNRRPRGDPDPGRRR